MRLCGFSTPGAFSFKSHKNTGSKQSVPRVRRCDQNSRKKFLFVFYHPVSGLPSFFTDFSSLNNHFKDE